MKKFLTILLCVICLCGCARVQGSLQEDLDQRLTVAEARSADAANYNHGLYRYYCPSDIGRMGSSELGNVFCMDQVRFAMNLNVSSIINKTYYTDVSAQSFAERAGGAILAQHKGNYTDSSGVDHTYCVTIVQDVKEALVAFESDTVEFLGMGNELECSLLSAHMLRMAKSLKVDEEAVVATYSNRTMITYVRKKVDLFQDIAPESGAIEELFDTGHETVDEPDIEYNGDNFGPAQKPQSTENPEQDILEEIKSGSH